jgi:capsid protein
MSPPNSGEDFEDILDQREIETEAFERRGLTPPSWTGASPRGAQNTPATDGTAPPPKKPKAPIPGTEEPAQ